MKTIFITSFHPLISRNIIGTNIIDRLTQSGAVRVVALVPDYKRAFFGEMYARTGLIFEGVDVGPASQSKIVNFFKRLAVAMPNTRRAVLGRRVTFFGEKPFLVQFLFYTPAGWLGRLPFMVEVVRFLDIHLTPRERFYRLFERYDPDLVFSTDVQNEHDVALLQDAKRKGIPTMGMVRSWDVLSARTLRIIPDRLLVHNSTIKREAETINGVSPEKIAVVGIPHYDRYLAGQYPDRRKFLESLSLDSSKKLIIYAPVCNYRLRENMVDRFVLEILSALDVNVIVRFPPSTEVNLDGFQKPSRMFFDRPGYAFRDKVMGDREVTPEDDERLRGELNWCDLVISGPSTIIIDAAVFDKPIILVDFYPRRVRPQERIYEYDVEHIAPILKSGGVRMARSRGEFLDCIRDYLAHPDLDRAGRKKIVGEQCWKLDGHSGDRVTRFILDGLR